MAPCDPASLQRPLTAVGHGHLVDGERVVAEVEGEQEPAAGVDAALRDQPGREAQHVTVQTVPADSQIQHLTVLAANGMKSIRTENVLSNVYDIHIDVFIMPILLDFNKR